MPIVHQDRKFLLSAAHSSYGFGVTKAGLLRHLHWGGRIALADLPDPDTLYRTFIYMSDRRREILRQEYPAWGGELYTEHALKVDFPDQVRCSLLKYCGYAIAGEHLTVELRDEHYPLRVELHYEVHPEYDLIDRWSVIINEGTGQVVLRNAQSAAWYVPAGIRYRMTYLSGRWGAEHQVNRVPVPQAKMQLESRTGLSGPFHDPWLALDDGHASEEQGRVYMATLQWSGNWKITVETDSCGQVSVLGGLHDFDFSYPLPPGASLVTPVFTGGCSDHGFGGVSRLLHDYQRDELMPQTIMGQPMPLLFNSWGSMGIQVSEEAILEIATKAASLGAELFVIDDGWQAALGDWYPDPVKFPEGLRKTIEQVRRLGMDFGLWVEIESFEVKSQLYQEHPEWALRFDGIEPYYNYRGDIDRTSVMLNLARPEVRDYLLAALRRLLRETGIRYLKLDMNSYLTNPGWESVPVERRQTVWVDYVRNLHAIFRQLGEEFPEVMFENCAAGGGRVDLAMMHYFSRINRSDNQDALDVLSMHEGFTYMHPSRSAGGACHISDACCQVNHRNLPLSYQAFAGMMGSLAIGKDLRTCPAETLEQIAAYGRLYKRFRHITHFGDLYRLQTIRHSSAAVFEFVCKDRSEALVFVFAHSIQFVNIGLPVRLEGLDEEGIYTQEVFGENPLVMAPLSRPLSGRALHELGVVVPLTGDLDSRLLYYRRLE